MWTTAVIVFLFVFVLVLILPLHYSNPVHSNENNPMYAPVDTAIISYPHPFCEQLHITRNTDQDFPVLATLYLLNQWPTLEKEDFSTFYIEIELPSLQYEYRRVFSYPGSNITFSACSLDPLPSPWGVFYLVKGNRNFARWRNGQHGHYYHKQDIYAACLGVNSTYTFEVGQEDNYYFIFEKLEASLTALGVTFTFDRVLYEVVDSAVITDCFILLNTSSSCQVDVPLGSKAVALLELDTLEPGMNEWEANIGLNVECADRVWLYAVLGIAVFAFLGGLIITSIFFHYLRSWRKKKKSSRQIGFAQEDSTLVDGDNAPPTYDTYDAPPPYKPE